MDLEQPCITSQDIDFGELINILKSCYLPEQKYEIDESLQPEQFTYHIKNTENNLEKCLSILCRVSKLPSQNIVREVITNIVLVCGEYQKQDLWASELCVGFSQLLINRLLEIVDCPNVSRLLLNNKVCTFLFDLRPKLEKNSWRKYPAAVSSFVWILSNLECPYLGDHISSILPTCLLLVDDCVTSNKVIGLNCLQHLVRNVSRAELRQYGRGDVIYQAVEHLPYSREPDLLRALIACLIPLLNKTEHNAITKTLKWNRFDNVMMVWLNSMALQQNLEMREIYLDGLQQLVPAMGLSSVRWSNQLFDILSDYCDHETTCNKSLECLITFIEVAWPRIVHNFSRVTVIALKVLIIVVKENQKQSLTMQLLRKLMQKIEKVDKNKYQELVRDLKDTSDFKELLAFLTFDDGE